MTTDIWNAEQYLKFEADRLRPFLDLVAHMDTDDVRVAAVVDLGCGPGNATALLADWWPDARILGVDASQAMIDAAREHAVPGRVEFELGDVWGWAPEEPVDVLLANAVLQWVPGHLDLLAGLASHVAPGGLLGFQVPGNFDEPSHTVLGELRGSAKWRDKVSSPLAQPAVHAPAEYLATLVDSGLEPDVWETTYMHILPSDPDADGPSGVTEFVGGTTLRPILNVLSKEDAAEFTAEYDALIRAAYPVRTLSDRTVQLLPYRRIFAIGRQS